MTRTVLVTGASGFIGRHCLRALADRGYRVHAVSRRREMDASVVWHHLDLLDSGARRKLIDAVEPTHLLHLAWYLVPGQYAESPINIDWLAASLDLIRRFQETGGRRVVVTGTCFEYEWSNSRLDETTPLLPRTLYGHAKRLLFEALSTWMERGGPEFAWARVFFLFGPGEDRRRLAADVAANLLLGREVSTTKGRQRRDYMFVEDAGLVLAALVDSDVTGAINVATGNALPVGNLVTEIADAIGRLDLVRFGARPTPPNDPECLEADISRLRNELGWSQFTPTKEAVQRTVNWWRVELGLPAQ